MKTNKIESFFVEPVDPRQEARELAQEAICRFLLWVGDAPTTLHRGLRTSVALYCLRPDLLNHATLEDLGDTVGCTRQAIHQLVRSFRNSTGIET